MWSFKKKQCPFCKEIEEHALTLGPTVRLIHWWDDMKPDWDYLRKHNPPSICPYVPAGWYTDSNVLCYNIRVTYG